MGAGDRETPGQRGLLSQRNLAPGEESPLIFGNLPRKRGGKIGEKEVSCSFPRRIALLKISLIQNLLPLYGLSGGFKWFYSDFGTILDTFGQSSES